MADVSRLLRRKERLTSRLRELDRAHSRHRPLPERKLLRARIYRVDLLLEREGVFG